MAWMMILLLLLLPGEVGAAEEITTVFRMKDNIGDNRGDGSLNYPTHPVYADRSVLDLIQFTVSRDNTNVYFDLGFGKIDNPFNAPEGYYHQRVEIYINTALHQGAAKLPLSKLNLSLTPEYGWDYRLRVAPFNGTMGFLSGEADKAHPLSSALLADEKAIRVTVPQAIIAQPTKQWRYYVIVGGFDGLVEDGWRISGAEETPWAFSGNSRPVSDILAPRWGPHSQSRQLKEGVLQPVYVGWQQNLPWYQLFVVVILLLTALNWGFFSWLNLRRNRHLK